MSNRKSLHKKTIISRKVSSSTVPSVGVKGTYLDSKAKEQIDFSPLVKAFNIPKKLLKSIWTHLQVPNDDEYKDATTYMKKLLSGEEKWIFNHSHAMAFLNTTTMEGMSDVPHTDTFLYSERDPKDFTTMDLPEEFHPENLKKIDEYFKWKAGILFPNGTIYDPEQLSEALSVFYKGEIKNVQLLLHKKRDYPLIIKSGDYEIYLVPLTPEDDLEENRLKPESSYSIDDMLHIGTIATKKAKIPFYVRELAEKIEVGDVFLNNILYQFITKQSSFPRYGAVTEDDIPDMLNSIEKKGILLSKDETMAFLVPKYKEETFYKLYMKEITKLVQIPENIDLTKLKIKNLSEKKLEEAYPDRNYELLYILMPDGKTFIKVKQLMYILRSIYTTFSQPNVQFISNPEGNYPIIIKANDHQFVLAHSVFDELDPEKDNVIPFEEFLRLGIS